MAWRRFVDRFLAGLADDKFIEAVGPAVVATNAATGAGARQGRCSRYGSCDR
jgi:hypothetical protein